MNTSEWEQSIDIRVDNSNRDQAAESVLQYPTVELSGAGRIRDAEAIISKVMEVAESNQTIERILERRHEVKDAAAKDSYTQKITARSNEELVAQQVLSSSPVSSHVHPLSHASSRPVLKRLVSTNSLYGYAVRYGFFSALLALLLAVITVNLFT